MDRSARSIPYALQKEHPQFLLPRMRHICAWCSECQDTGLAIDGPICLLDEGAFTSALCRHCYTEWRFQYRMGVVNPLAHWVALRRAHVMRLRKH